MASHKFPNWAPNELVAERNKRAERLKDICIQVGLLGANEEIEHLDEEDRSDLLILDKLISDSRMERIWAKVKQLGIKPLSLLLTVEIAHIGPIRKTEKLATKEYTDWVKEVRAKASELACLLEGSGYDELVQKIHFDRFKKRQLGYVFSSSLGHLKSEKEGKKQQKKFKVLEEELRASHTYFKPDLVSEILRKFENLTEAECEQDSYFYKDKERPRLGRPNAPKANRNWFVKSITMELMKQTGNPCRELVIDLVGVVFEEVVDAKSIREMTSSL